MSILEVRGNSVEFIGSLAENLNEVQISRQQVEILGSLAEHQDRAEVSIQSVDILLSNSADTVGLSLPQASRGTSTKTILITLMISVGDSWFIPQGENGEGITLSRTKENTVVIEIRNTLFLSHGSYNGDVSGMFCVFIEQKNLNELSVKINFEDVPMDEFISVRMASSGYTSLAGFNYNSINTVNASLGEIIVFNSLISEDNLAILETYMRNKWLTPFN